MRDAITNICRRFFNWFDRLLGKPMASEASGEILCDSCKYNYRGACGRPERPNATVCADYKRSSMRD